MELLERGQRTVDRYGGLLVHGVVADRADDVELESDGAAGGRGELYGA